MEKPLLLLVPRYADDPVGCNTSTSHDPHGDSL